MAKILRAGLYERVSTEEQKLRGYSIRAQKENLEEYCQDNRIKIVDHYTDEGISGSKPPLKRPDLQRLLDDIEAGKIDIILFTKLDRWFRSVKEYFKVQEVLDNNKVEWRAIHENYDTTTANGRMAITIFLAVAQNERDRTAERIEAVMASKRKNKEACFGGRAIPLGYIRQPDENGVMRLVKDPETKQAMQEFWDILIETNNRNKAIRHMHNVHGIKRDPRSWQKITQSDFYSGIHRGVQDFCEPYVTPEQFLKFQESRPIKSTPTGRVYLFSGMLRCPMCGHVLCGNTNTARIGKGRSYKSYRCSKNCRGCEYKQTISEKKLEKMMLSDLEKHIQAEIDHVTVEASRPRRDAKPNILKNLKEQRRRLEIVYMAGNKSDEEYLKEDAELKLAIEKAEKEAPAKPRDLEPLKEILNSDFRTLYNSFTEEEKQEFWNNLVKEIVMEDRKIKKVIFN